MFFQVFPPSSDLYTPSPHDELCRLFGSPEPTHTIDGSEAAIAMSPIVETPSLSNTGSNVVPLFVVFHTPPEAAAIYTMLGLLSTTATSSMRPPIAAGPISRNSRLLNLSVGLVWPDTAEGTAAQTKPASATTPNTPRPSFHSMSYLPQYTRPGMILRQNEPRITCLRNAVLPMRRGENQGRTVWLSFAYRATKAPCYAIQLFPRPACSV